MLDFKWATIQPSAFSTYSGSAKKYMIERYNVHNNSRVIFSPLKQVDYLKGVAGQGEARFPLGDFFRANKQKANVIGW